MTAVKYRLIDLLQCTCGGSKLEVRNSVTQRVSFTDVFDKVQCVQGCAFKECEVSSGRVQPQDCAECYAHEVVQGTIACECGREWQISKGIPRFIPDDLATDLRKIQATFSSEWEMFRFGERNWGQDIDFRRNQFVRGMNVEPEGLKGSLIFDAGCGSGLLSMEMGKRLGMEVVALDLAFGIEQAYERNDSPHVHFVQGSVLQPPLRDSVFDFIYCAGVLVACPDTRTGFEAIIRTLKRGGRCFVWLYHPIDAEHYPHILRKMRIYDWLRANVTSRLPIRVQYHLYLSAMPLFLLKQEIEILLGKKRYRGTWREKMQDLFDFFSPIYQNRHTTAEVLQWYAKQGFANAEVAYKEEHGFAVRGDLG